MSKEISWREKFELVLKEELTIKEIMLLCSVGQPRASLIRKKAIELCMNDDIKLYSLQVPTEAVLKVINKDINYYRNKMNLEFEINGFRR